MKTPATLSPDDPDQVIFDVMTERHLFRVPLVESRINPRRPSQRQAWSRTQDRWLNPTEYAAEWRHRWRYRAVMGTEEEARAVSDYERSLGL